MTQVTTQVQPLTLATFNEDDALLLWKALDTSHQATIVEAKQSFGNHRTVVTQRRQELYQALELLEQLCSHMPRLRALAITLKETPPLTRA